MAETERRGAEVDNLLAQVIVNAWRDGCGVQELVDATQNTRFTAHGAHCHDLWLSAMLGN